MTVQDIRLSCLKLAKPDASVPDVELWVRMAGQLEAYVREGQADPAPEKRRGRPPKVHADTPAFAGPVPDTVS